MGGRSSGADCGVIRTLWCDRFRERGVRSSWLGLRSHDVPWCRAVPIPTGGARKVREPLEPWPRATLGAWAPCGMVHRDQVGCRNGAIISGQR